jgi:dienelactone hydrolase
MQKKRLVLLQSSVTGLPQTRGRGCAGWLSRQRRAEIGEEVLPIGSAAIPLALLIFLAMLAGSCAGDQARDRRPGPVEMALGPDNRQLWWVPIDAGVEQFLLETMVYRPSGPGPFPLVTIDHGKPRPGSTDPSTMHPGFGAAAHWFVDRGFAVAVPMRRGYGLSQGPISDTVGPCSDRDYFATALKTAAEMEGVVAYLRTQSFIDRNRVVVVGQSYGGLGALGVAYDKPEGVIGIVNFAGGAGSNRPGEICSGRERLIAAVGKLGERNRLPQVWLYAANDHYFEPSLAHAMVEAYRAKSRAPVIFIDLPPFGEDGHLTFTRGDPAIWAAPVNGYLASLQTAVAH